MKRALPASENITQQSETRNTQHLDPVNVPVTCNSTEQLSEGINAPVSSTVPLQVTLPMYMQQGLNRPPVPEAIIPPMHYMRPNPSLTYNSYMPVYSTSQLHNPAIRLPPAHNVPLQAFKHIPNTLDVQTLQYSLQYLLPQLTTVLSSLSSSSNIPQTVEKNDQQFPSVLDSQLGPSTVGFANTFLPASTMAQDQSTGTIFTQAQSSIITPDTKSTHQHPVVTSIPSNSKPPSPPVSPSSKRIKLSSLAE